MPDYEMYDLARAVDQPAARRRRSATASVDQRNAPDDFYYDGEAWENLAWCSCDGPADDADRAADRRGGQLGLRRRGADRTGLPAHGRSHDRRPVLPVGPAARPGHGPRTAGQPGAGHDLVAGGHGPQPGRVAAGVERAGPVGGQQHQPGRLERTRMGQRPAGHARSGRRGHVHGQREQFGQLLQRDGAAQHQRRPRRSSNCRSPAGWSIGWSWTNRTATAASRATSRG